MIDDAFKQMTDLPRWVQLWMRWLNIVFLIGIAFAVSHVEARWALGVYLVSFPVGFFFFYFVRDIKITGVPHIVLWLPLMSYMILSAANDAEFPWLSLYGVWLGLLSFTITVSVILDVKGLAVVVTRSQKTP